MATASTESLVVQHMLLIEDDWIIADELAVALEDRGVEVVGPAGTVEQALALIAATPQIDAALLDINLRGELVFPVADALLERGVPFVFVTGYNTITIPIRYTDVPCCEKPVDLAKVEQALFG
jgi:ActR/RegA family two-component response regulator